MAVGDLTETDAQLVAVPPSEATDVRHFDQLGHDEQHAFLQLYLENDPDPETVPLEAGEVVVFTDYYRVVR